MCTWGICRPSIGQYPPLTWQPTVSRYIDRYQVDMSAETQSTYRPISTERHVSQHTPILHGHSAATWPILYRHSANTTFICLALAILSSIFSNQLRGAFIGHRPILAFNSSNIHVFFPAMFFPRHPFLYTTLITFRSSSIWGLLLTRLLAVQSVFLSKFQQGLWGETI